MFDKHYAKYYDLFNRSKPYKKEIKFVYEWAECPERIFDVGSGTAVYWKYFPEHVKLFGVDSSPNMIERADLSRGTIVWGDIRTHLHRLGKFDCVTCLFDVINYLPNHGWWENLPLEKGGYFIFDVFDKQKIEKEGFNQTIKKAGNVTRTITPLSYDHKVVVLEVKIDDGGVLFTEVHPMYIYSHHQIEKFCGDEFEIAEVKETKRWQTWFKLIKK